VSYMSDAENHGTGSTCRHTHTTTGYMGVQSTSGGELSVKRACPAAVTKAHQTGVWRRQHPCLSEALSEALSLFPSHSKCKRGGGVLLSTVDQRGTGLYTSARSDSKIEAVLCSSCGMSLTSAPYPPKYLVTSRRDMVRSFAHISVITSKTLPTSYCMKWNLITSSAIFPNGR
jgi:hypothetical protein